MGGGLKVSQNTYIPSSNSIQFPLGENSNQGILAIFNSSGYWYTHFWTQRKYNIGGQNTHDVEKSG